MKAQPGPMVSGRYFFPNAPLLCVKQMPAWAVMSRKWIWAVAECVRTSAGAKTQAHKKRKRLAVIRRGKLLEILPITSRLRKKLSPSFARPDGRGRPSPHEHLGAPSRARGSPAARCCLQD